MSNTIVRAPRRHRFVIIDQRAIEDTRLSWAARGLLGYLLSRPDDWKVLINDLRKRGDLGRDGIYRLLRELRDTGYVLFVHTRDRHGRIRGGSYLVQEIAHPPHPVNPDALPNTDLDLRPTTTTVPTITKGGLEFSAWVPEELRAQAISRVARLDVQAAQSVIDEWAGALAAGRVERSPLGYLHALVARFESGDLRWRYADAVAASRKQARNRP